MRKTAVLPLPVYTSDVAIVFLGSAVLKDAKISAIRVHLRQI